MDGDMTGDTDTNYHRPLKTKHSNLEQELMVRLLTEKTNKVPSLKRDGMMRMSSGARSKVQNQIDTLLAFQQNLISIVLDGSEDYVISPKLRDIVEKIFLNRESF